MGATKYPVLNENFYVDMFANARNDEQRALIFILSETGMHPMSIGNAKLKREGGNVILEWTRPKTKKKLQISLKHKDRIKLVESFLNGRRKTASHYNTILKDIGEEAGYDGISFMTFRHTYCIRLLLEGHFIWEVPHLMGATLDVVSRNYSYTKREGVDLREFRYKTLQ